MKQTVNLALQAENLNEGEKAMKALEYIANLISAGQNFKLVGK